MVAEDSSDYLSSDVECSAASMSSSAIDLAQSQGGGAGGSGTFIAHNQIHSHNKV